MGSLSPMLPSSREHRDAETELLFTLGTEHVDRVNRVNRVKSADAEWHECDACGRYLQCCRHPGNTGMQYQRCSALWEPTLFAALTTLTAVRAITCSGMHSPMLLRSREHRDAVPALLCTLGTEHVD